MERSVIDSDDEETFIFMEPYCTEAELLKLASKANALASLIPNEGNKFKINKSLNETLAFGNEEMPMLSQHSSKCSITEFDIKRTKKENRYFKFSFNKEAAKDWKSGFSNYWPNNLYDINDCLTLRKKFRIGNKETEVNLISRGIQNYADSPINILSPISCGSSEDNYRQQGKQKDFLVKHATVVSSVLAPTSTLVSDHVNFEESSNCPKEFYSDHQKVHRRFKNGNNGGAQNVNLNEIKESVIKSAAETSNEDRLSDLCYDPYRYERCKVYLRGERCQERYCRALHKLPKEDNVYCRSYLKNSICQSDYPCPYLHYQIEANPLKLSVNEHKSLPSSRLSTNYDDGYSSEERNNLYRYNKKNTLSPSIDNHVKIPFESNSDTKKVDMAFLNKVCSEKYNGSLSGHMDQLKSSINDSFGDLEDKTEVSDMDVDESTDDEIVSTPSSPDNCSEDGDEYKFPVLMGVGDILSKLRSEQNNSKKEKVLHIEKQTEDKSQDRPLLKTNFLETDASTHTEKLIDNLISQNILISNTEQFQLDHIPATIEPTKDLALQTASNKKKSSCCEMLDNNNLRKPVTEVAVCHPVISKCVSSEKNLIHNKLTLIYSNNNAASNLPCLLVVNDTQSPRDVCNLSPCVLANKDPNEDTLAVKSRICSTSDSQSHDSLELSKITPLASEMKQKFFEVPTQKGVLFFNDGEEYNFLNKTEHSCDSIVSVEKPTINSSLLHTCNFSLKGLSATENNNKQKSIFETTNIDSSLALNNDKFHNVSLAPSVFQENSIINLKFSKINSSVISNKLNEPVSEIGIGKILCDSKVDCNKSDCDSDSSCENTHRPIMPLGNLVDLLKHSSENIKDNDNLDHSSLSLNLNESKLSLTDDSLIQKNTLKKLALKTIADTCIPTSSAENILEKKHSLQFPEVGLLEASSKVNQQRLNKNIIKVLPSSFRGKEGTKKKSDKLRKDSNYKKSSIEKTIFNVSKGKFRDLMPSSSFRSKQSLSSKENNRISEPLSSNEDFQSSSNSTFKIPKLKKKSSMECFAKETGDKNCLKSVKTHTIEEIISIAKVSSDRCMDVKKIRHDTPKSKHKSYFNSNKSDSHVPDKNSRGLNQSIVSPLSDKIISNQTFHSSFKFQNYHYKPKPKCKKIFDCENNSKLQLLKRKSKFSPELSMKKVLIDKEISDDDGKILVRKEASLVTTPFLDNHPLTMFEKNMSENTCLKIAHNYLQIYSPEYDTTDVFKEFESLCEKFKISCIEKSTENNFDMLDRNVRRFAVKLFALDSGCEADDAEIEYSLNEYRILSLKAFIELINTT